LSRRRSFAPPETPTEIRAAAQRAARHREHDSARERADQQLIDLITAISAADVATARAAVWGMASGRAGTVGLIEHLRAHPDALRSGSSAAPASLLRLALALHAAGVSGLVLPRCVDCNGASPRLDRVVAGGRLCGPCVNARAAGPCRICARLKPAVSRDATGAPICSACRTKADSNIKACGLCGNPSRVRQRINGIVLGVCCSVPLQARCTVCGWRKGVHAYKTRRPLCAVCAAGPTATCSQCGQHAPLPTTDSEPACCARCTRRKPSTCRDCGQLSTRKPRPGQQSQCPDCYRRPTGICGRCGRERVIVRLAVDGDPGLCGVCWHGPTTTCAGCGQLRACRGERRGRMLCQSCSPRPLYRCARCGQQRHSAAELGEGRICQACYSKALAAKGSCPGCGNVRRLLTYPGHPDALCADCAGIPARRVCRDCGNEDSLYAAGRCPPCSLTIRLDALLGPPDAPRRPELEPLRAALHAVTPARTALDWLHRSRSAKILRTILSDNEIELTHDTLDALPPSNETRFLDYLLTAAGVLPERDHALARLETWVNRTLDASTHDAADLRALRTWLTWMVLPRRRRGPALTDGAVNGVKKPVHAVLTLLDRLGEEDARLADLDQTGLDEWITSTPDSYGNARPFLLWATRRHLAGPLTLPPRATSRRRPIQPADWDLARRLLHDPLPEPGTLERAAQLRIRIAGLLVLLYAQPVSRISRLTLDRITAHGATVELSLGATAITAPPALAALISTHLAERRYLSAVQPAQDPGWLFPGASPGRPITPTAFAVQLRRGGVHTGTARPAALLHLASSMPAAVLADLLGISIGTATQLTATTGLSWARYVGTRTATDSIRPPMNN